MKGSDSAVTDFKITISSRLPLCSCPLHFLPFDIICLYKITTVSADGDIIRSNRFPGVVEKQAPLVGWKQSVWLDVVRVFVRGQKLSTERRQFNRISTSHIDLNRSNIVVAAKRSPCTHNSTSPHRRGAFVSEPLKKPRCLHTFPQRVIL
jgi:hypothetical protein